MISVSSGVNSASCAIATLLQSSHDRKATRPEDFIVTPQPLAGRPGVFRSLQVEWFVVDHLRPRPEAEVILPAGNPMHTLHALRGTMELQTTDGRTLAALTRGQSALIPVAIGSYRLVTTDGDAEVVMVTILSSAGVQTRIGEASGQPAATQPS